jgi:hypothetical protein
VSNRPLIFVGDLCCGNGSKGETMWLAQNPGIGKISDQGGGRWRTALPSTEQALETSLSAAYKSAS